MFTKEDVVAEIVTDLTESVQDVPAPRPRCRVCQRRLRSVPWKYLLIGPICAKKNPELAALARNEFAGRHPNAESNLVDSLDAALHKVGVTTDVH
jgi:hypothetical protein